MGNMTGATRRGIEVLSLVLLSQALAQLAAGGEPEPAQPRVARPDLTLRATPSTAFSPATVMVVAKLVGGEDSEEFYCPAVEWDWGDGSRSMREGDCPPFDEGTRIARTYSVLYRYHEAGDFRVRLTLRRAGRAVASATVSVRVLGRGDEDAGPPGSAAME
jgi:hypothetical protein